MSHEEWLKIIKTEKLKIERMETLRTTLEKVAKKLSIKVNESDDTKKLAEIIKIAIFFRNTIETALLSDMVINDVIGVKEDYKTLSRIIVEANDKAQKMINKNIDIGTIDKQLKEYLNKSKNWQKIIRKHSN